MVDMRVKVLDIGDRIWISDTFENVTGMNKYKQYGLLNEPQERVIRTIDINKHGIVIYGTGKESFNNSFIGLKNVFTSKTLAKIGNMQRRIEHEKMVAGQTWSV